MNPNFVGEFDIPEKKMLIYIKNFKKLKKIKFKKNLIIKRKFRISCSIIKRYY